MQQAVDGCELKASLQMHWWSCLTQELFSSDWLERQDVYLFTTHICDLHDKQNPFNSLQIKTNSPNI